MLKVYLGHDARPCLWPDARHASGETFPCPARLHRPTATKARASLSTSSCA
ncbi:hypothetical protein SAMN04488078_100238 [Antarctobacter heliothermus]|uniref:Uncharacterized protein n=1 Tax=Antarctobacter heliothermus TaxID=74033 RepID=A0A239B3D3_9RHOB|nr:hypothetical protein SAMN04488078_100238 [Antarctobacter heliothermus]